MQIRSEFPRPTRTIANTFIPLADGTRLAARIWLPEDAEADPVPAILEYIPYRKDDGTAARDALMHPWWAGHGYANVRVDQRGSGDSDGIILDEYTKQEHDEPSRCSPGSPRSPGAPARSASSASRGAASTGCRSPRGGRPSSAASISRRLDRRPLRRRHPLHRRRAARLPEAVLGVDDAGLQRAPAGPAVRGRALAREVARAARPDAAVHPRRGSRTSAATRSGSTARSCEDYSDIEVPVVHGRRLAGRLHRRHLPLPRGLRGPVQGPVRAVGARLSAVGRAEARDRLPAGGAALLGRTLKGVDNGVLTSRRCAPGSRSGSARRRATSSGPAAGSPRPPGRRRRPSRRRCTSRRRRPGRGAGAARRAAFAGLQHTGLGRRRLDGLGLRGRRPARPARRGRALALLHLGAAARARRDARASRRRADAGLGPAAGARRRARLRRLTRRRVDCSSRRGFLNLTHRDSHEHPEPLEPGAPYEVRVPAERPRARLPGRPPHPRRALPDLLAVHVALARAGHADGARRSRQLARVPRAPAARPRTTRCRRSRSPRWPSRSRSSTAPAAARRAPSSRSTAASAERRSRS